jgi:hypothetical protein
MTVFNELDHLTTMIHMNIDALWFQMKALGGSNYLDRLARAEEMLDPDSAEARRMAADIDTLADLAHELSSLRERLITTKNAGAKKPPAESVERQPTTRFKRMTAAE